MRGAGFRFRGVWCGEEQQARSTGIAATAFHVAATTAAIIVAACMATEAGPLIVLEYVEQRNS